MFDEFLKNCPPEEGIEPSEERVEKNIASLRSLIEKEDKEDKDDKIFMTKRRSGLKSLIIAAAIAILSGVSLLSVSAAIQISTVNFLMDGKEIEGEYYDYVDSEGYHRVSFGAVLPLDEENFAIIYDVDAPQGENVRVITEETDPEFAEKLRLYIEARDNYRVEHGTAANAPEPEDFGLVFKDSEFGAYVWINNLGFFGGNFMYSDAAEGKPGGGEVGYADYDYENNTKTFKAEFYYYVGKE